MCIRDRDKHVFIEKPVTETVGQAKHLMELALEHKIVMQVGHVERYNPAIIPLENKIKNPRFIEGHRLALFNPRGTDVSVVLDLMIHDLDLVLSIVKSEVSDVAANGVCIVSSTPDICNARIESVSYTHLDVYKRQEGVPGTHKVKYSSEIDDIEIIHTAHSRAGFALGAVLAAEWLVDKKGNFQMKDVLGL